MAEVPTDPWGAPYHYVAPSPDGRHPFGIYSRGRDRISRSGGNDPDDINTWNESRPWDKTATPADVTIRITLLVSFFLFCLVYIVAKKTPVPE